MFLHYNAKLIFIIALLSFSACRQRSNCEDDAHYAALGIDNQEMFEYYQLGLSANVFVLQHEILKTKQQIPIKDIDYTDLVGHRVIGFKCTVFDENFKIDTVYQHSQDSLPIHFKPLMTNEIRGGVGILKNQYIKQQEFLGIDSTAKFPHANIMLFQSLFIVKNKIMATEMYFKVPICYPLTVFEPLSAEKKHNKAVFFKDILQKKSNTPDYHLKTALLKDLYR